MRRVRLSIWLDERSQVIQTSADAYDDGEVVGIRVRGGKQPPNTVDALAELTQWALDLPIQKPLPFPATASTSVIEPAPKAAV